MNFNRNRKILDVCADFGEPSFRLKQIYQAVYQKDFTRYSEISNISIPLRQVLEKELGNVLTLEKLVSNKGENVEKILFKTRDDERIEAVLMEYKGEDNKPHKSLCVSNQIGCNMGCKFCVTGNLVKLKRNLTADEIVDQVLYFRKSGIEVDSVFFSGMGEPLANPHFFEALDTLISKDFVGMSARKFSISTVGVIDGIGKITDKYPQVNLAFSLHSPFEEEREKLMPANRAYPLSEVMKTLDKHIEISNKKVFLAYVMLKNVNDSADHAVALAELIRSRGKKSYLYHVNLIRFHQGSSKEEFESSDNDRIKKFMNVLKRKGINCTLRMSFGSDIEAACRQLYA